MKSISRVNFCVLSAISDEPRKTADLYTNLKYEAGQVSSAVQWLKRKELLHVVDKGNAITKDGTKTLKLISNGDIPVKKEKGTPGPSRASAKISRFQKVKAAKNSSPFETLSDEINKQEEYQKNYSPEPEPEPEPEIEEPVEEPIEIEEPTPIKTTKTNRAERLLNDFMEVVEENENLRETLENVYTQLGEALGKV